MKYKEDMTLPAPDNFMRLRHVRSYKRDVREVVINLLATYEKITSSVLREHEGDEEVWRAVHECLTWVNYETNKSTGRANVMLQARMGGENMETANGA